MIWNRQNLPRSWRFGAFATVLVIAAAQLFSGDVTAQQLEDRPLGVLIQSHDAGNAAKTRSALPDAISGNAATRSTPQTRTTTELPNRPLGALIRPLPTPTATPSRSVLPQGWGNTTLNDSTTTAPSATAGSSGRPLGTLIDQTPRTVAPQTDSNDSQQAPISRPIVRASRIVPPAAGGATSQRPLGTLFGTAVQEPIAAPVMPINDSKPLVPNVTPTANAEPLPEANFSADNMTYDRDLGLVTASGNVIVEYGGRTLAADTVTYNRKTDVVKAIGNASLTETNGETLFGDRMEVTGDLKDGVIFNIGLILADRSRVAGTGARRSNGTVTDMRNAVYSPCNLCEDDPSAAPLWQLKAVKVVHNAEEKTVEYRDAWLEMFGVPVFYTPYLSHPDPTVKRRSGFLAPSFSNSSDLGLRFDTPYFWAIDDHQDATFSPLITTDGGKGAIAEYRRAFTKGEVKANGSFVADDPDEDFRGYIDIDAEYHIDKTWRAGLNLENTTDDTYTRRYGFDTDSVLVSRGYLEGFKGKNYQSLNMYAFNDLRPDSESKNSPFIAPVYDFNYIGKRDRLGGRSAFDLNVLNLHRESGTDTRRISIHPRWDRPFTGQFGELYNLSFSVAADGYHASDVELENGNEETGFAGRIMPRASFTWRLPLVRPGNDLSHVIEPIAALTVAPNGGNPEDIPNEDSPGVEFDETNIFSENLYGGLDRVDGGTKLGYGINWSVSGEKYGSSSVFVGQLYRPRKNSDFGPGSGLDEKFSDFVGRVQVDPADYFSLSYRTQFRSDNFSPQRNEISADIGGHALKLNANYIFIDQQQDSEFDGREELWGTLTSNINEYWSTAISGRYDEDNKELRTLGFNITYEDECVKFISAFTRSEFSDRDLKPSDTITFTLVLKTLGEVTSGVSP